MSSFLDPTQYYIINIYYIPSLYTVPQVVMGCSHSKGTKKNEEASKSPRRKSSKKKSKQKGICKLDDLCPSLSTNVGSETVHDNIQSNSATPEYSIDELYPRLKPLLKKPAGTESCDGGPVRRYPTSSPRRGPVFIINNFSGYNGFKFRRGSNIDVSKLRTVFNELNFSVHDREGTNLTARKMKNHCIDLARRNYSDVDCVVVVILTHGVKDGYLNGIDNECVRLLELISPFYSNPTLIGKPKIFIIQACRGEEKSIGIIEEPSDSKTSTSSANPGRHSEKDFGKSSVDNSFEIVENDENEAIVEGYVNSGFLPRNADIVVAYSSSEEEVAYRNVYTGAWYIEELTKALSRSKEKKMHFIDILTEVQGMMSNLTKSDQKKNVTYVQMPEFRSTLRGPLYL